MPNVNVTAIVAARGGSVRLPNKALLPFPRGGSQS
jgi:spore coat polysaccharide biosynthesis protein SpsF (cytidylyltransferase family)